MRMKVAEMIGDRFFTVADKGKGPAGTATSDADQNSRAGTRRGQNRTTWFTVGVKLILGVGLVSNLCMGGLLYTSWQASCHISGKTNELLTLNTQLNADLRSRIAVLQEKYLQIPFLLTVNPDQAIAEKIRSSFPGTQEERLEGRETYGRYFDRKQRRDIAKGGFVVFEKDGVLLAAQGILDGQGEFTEAVNLFRIAGADPKLGVAVLHGLIRDERAAADSRVALEARIARLKTQLADEGLAAEESRTQILYHVDRIRAGEKELARVRKARQTTSAVIAGITIALNLLVLYAMTWLHVERPLKRLTQTIERINGGQDVEIPFQKRKDKIGVLAEVLQSFKGALENLRAADVRKQKEQQVIQDLILTMTDLIEDLRTKSQTMKTASFELHDLAKDTSGQSDTAIIAITRTEDNAQKGAGAAVRLQDAVRHIHAHVARQNSLVSDITQATRQSLEKIESLNAASLEITDIVKMVKTIAGQTKLLALNARIEASRAGAAGKGFTVVANEVRELSLQTEAANQEIEARISAIQRACLQMAASTKGVDALSLSLSETGALIHEAVTGQKEMSDQIAVSASDTTDDAGDLSGRLSVVKDAAVQTRRLSEKVRSLSTDMDTALDDLLRHTREKLGQVGKTGTNSSLTIC